MERFADFVVTRSETVDLADADALAEAWRAWSTLFDPEAPEPSPAEFAALAATFAPAPPRREYPKPLAGWRFAGTLRRYQADVLDRVPVVAGEPLHIVAPPGSGKTLLGMLLAVEHGGRVLALAPTTTIRSQWARTALDLEGSAGAVSEDPRVLGDVTALTYQALSVLEKASPLEELAVADWVTELVGGGRTEKDATAWIDDLKSANSAAYRSGIARRSRNLRRRLAREDPAFLETALHPNAKALVERLVAHGVETIVLDECHHLLDHWALVVAYLAARIRAAGGVPLLVGLTATLPSPEDEQAYDTYTALLGDVDYEVPTPAVVKEGNLAPYRDFVRLTEPTHDELAFLVRHEQELAAVVSELLGDEEGIAFLVRALQPLPERPPLPPGAPAPPLHPEPPGPSAERLAAAFADDFAFAESAARMLVHVAPQHPLVALLPPETSVVPDSESSIRVLARFALDSILPIEERAEEWMRVKRLVEDFGYTLTDRGIRRGRDPIDTVLASSASKDAAAAEILRLELGRADGYVVKAVVVTDFAVHGNRRGTTARRAGALRCFERIAIDPALIGLRPVLVTAEHLRIATRDIPVLLPVLGAKLGVELRADTLAKSAHVAEIDTRGAGSSDVVAAVSDLVTEGVVGVIVGTRALLGEGWDCPAINTLIDLTSVATSSATQQLRGRTLRLDPAWPRKVAHNWTVTTLIPPSVKILDQPDANRMRRKHGRIWGLLREDSTQIVRGIPIALTFAQAGLLGGIMAKRPKASIVELNASILEELPSRAESYRDWRIGEPYVDRERVAAVVPSTARPFRTGVAMEVILVALLGLAGAIFVGIGAQLAPLMLIHPVVAVVVLAGCAGLFIGLGFPLFRLLAQAIRQDIGPASTYRRIVVALAQTYHEMGRMSQRYGHGDVASIQHRDGGHAVQIEVGLAAGPYQEQQLISSSLEELLGPVRVPRFLLQINRGTAPDSANPTARLAMWLIGRFSRRERYLPVPAAIGRRRVDAERFAAAWRREVGPCTLHELRSPEQLALLVRARRDSDGAPAPFAREAWS